MNVSVRILVGKTGSKTLFLVKLDPIRMCRVAPAIVVLRVHTNKPKSESSFKGLFMVSQLGSRRFCVRMCQTYIFYLETRKRPSSDREAPCYCRAVQPGPMRYKGKFI